MGRGAGGVGVHDGAGPSQKWAKPMAPAKTMGQRLSSGDLTSLAKVPGPGAYAVTGGIGQRHGVKTRNPEARFGREGRMGISTSSSLTNPGPGHYKSSSALGKQSDSRLRSSPSSSLSSRQKLAQKPADMMGPGVCREDSFLRPSTSPNKTWAPSYSFGGKLSSKSPERNNPGPGAYEHAKSSVNRQVVSTSASAPAFSLASRQTSNPKTDTCFPCREDSFTEQSKYSPEKGFSFGGRTMNGELAINEPPKNVPGPGTYGEIEFHSRQPHTALASPPQWSFGKEIRPEPKAGGGVARATNGPGSYELPRSCEGQHDSMRASSPNFSFGYAPSTLATQQAKATVKADAAEPLTTPGPGHYMMPTTLGAVKASVAVTKAPAVALAGREKFGGVDHVDTSGAGPGPAAFALATKGPSERITQSACMKVRFGSARRQELADGDRRVPGPGAYAHETFHSVKRAAPKFSMGARLERKSASSEAMGPGRCREDSSLGAQKSSTQWSKPSYSFGSRTKIVGLGPGKDAVPGPGAYG